MKKKHVISMLLVLCFVFVMPVGCKKTETEDTTLKQPLNIKQNETEQTEDDSVTQWNDSLQSDADDTVSQETESSSDKKLDTVKHESQDGQEEKNAENQDILEKNDEVISTPTANTESGWGPIS